MSASSVPRCDLCGRFMSGDDVLLGYGRSDGGNEYFVHHECYESFKKRLTPIDFAAPMSNPRTTSKDGRPDYAKSSHADNPQ